MRELHSKKTKDACTMGLECCNIQPMFLVNIYARLGVDAVYTFNKDGTIELFFILPQAGGKIGSATALEL